LAVVPWPPAISAFLMLYFLNTSSTASVPSLHEPSRSL
jgi:hypothetical protein